MSKYVISKYKGMENSVHLGTLKVNPLVFIGWEKISSSDEDCKNEQRLSGYLLSVCKGEMGYLVRWRFTKLNFPVLLIVHSEDPDTFVEIHHILPDVQLPKEEQNKKF